MLHRRGKDAGECGMGGGEKKKKGFQCKDAGSGPHCGEKFCTERTGKIGTGIVFPN